MKDEIQAGIKNAIERGYTIDEAIQSFISAGYNPVEVKEAASTIDSNIIPIINQVKSPLANSVVQNMTNNSANPPAAKSFNPSFQTQNSSQQQPMQQQTQPPIYNQSYQQYPKRSSKKKLVIILIIILIILVCAIVALSLSAKTILNTFFK